MTTTLDLPAALLRQIELRAFDQGRTIDEVTTNLLYIGLGHTSSSQLAQPQEPLVNILPNGLPIVRCDPAAPASSMTAEELVSLESNDGS